NTAVSPFRSMIMVAPFGISFGPAPSSTVAPGGIGSPRVGRHAGSSYGSMTGPRLHIHSPTVTVPPPVGGGTRTRIVSVPAGITSPSAPTRAHSLVVDVAVTVWIVDEPETKSM